MGWWSRLTRTFRDDGREDEIREELDFHLEMDARASEDPRGARLRLGNPARIREETRAAGICAWLESILQDLRYALRQFRRAPGLSLAVIASLAIGLGANTAIFSLIDAAVLRPLPVADPDRLIQLHWRNDGIPAGAGIVQRTPVAEAGGGLQGSNVSEPVFRALAEERTGFVSLIGVGVSSFEVAISAASAAAAEQVRALHVSRNFFDGLGVPPVLGRSFLEEEDRPGAELAIVVSHRFWSSRLDGDPDAIGRLIRINGGPARIAGVAPPGFFGPIRGEWIDVYQPMGSYPFNQFPGLDASTYWSVDLVARLAPGVSGDAAAAAITPLFRNLVAETTGTDIEAGLDLIARPAGRGLQWAVQRVDEVSRALWILMLLVGVLLLVVCANVANLLLSRSVTRRPESAVRLALGAGRGRLVRQHLVESGLLAVIGGAAGLGVGIVLARVVHAVFQTGQGPGAAFAVTLDWRVSAYAAAVATLTAVIFGLAPAWTAARSQVSDALKIQSRAVLGSGLRLPKLLVSVQFALSFAALVAAGLLGRSLGNLYATDLGFAGAELSFATVYPGRAGYPPPDIGPYLERLQQEIAAIPGVLAVAPLLTRPLDGGAPRASINAPDGPPMEIDTGIRNPAAMAIGSLGGPGYIDVLGLQLLAGRTLEPGDWCQPGGAPCPVVVDQRFAEVFFPGETAVGQVFDVPGRRLIVGGQVLQTSREVVGVVANARQLGLRTDAQPTMYEQVHPSVTSLSGHLAIRSKRDAGALAAAVQQAVARVDPSVPLAEFHTQSGLIDRLLRTERLLVLVSGAFSVAALALAAVGLAGLLAYAVARRTNEIGIRMALGATGAEVRRMVLRDSLWMVGSGVLIGIPAAYVVGRYLESSLFGLGLLDPITTSAALAALIVIALLASLLPAWRAAAVSPLTALREE